MADQVRMTPNFVQGKKWRDQPEPQWPEWFTVADGQAAEAEIRSKTREESLKEAEKTRALKQELKTIWDVAKASCAMFSWVVGGAIAAKAVLNATMHCVVVPGHCLKFNIRGMCVKLMDELGGGELNDLLKAHRENNQECSPHSKTMQQRDLRCKTPEHAIVEACSELVPDVFLAEKNHSLEMSMSGLLDLAEQGVDSVKGLSAEELGKAAEARSVAAFVSCKINHAKGNVLKTKDWETFAGRKRLKTGDDSD